MGLVMLVFVQQSTTSKTTYLAFISENLRHCFVSDQLHRRPKIHVKSPQPVSHTVAPRTSSPGPNACSTTELGPPCPGYQNLHRSSRDKRGGTDYWRCMRRLRLKRACLSFLVLFWGRCWSPGRLHMPSNRRICRMVLTLVWLLACVGRNRLRRI